MKNKALPYIAAGMALIALPLIMGIYSTWSSVTTAPARVINKTLQTNNILTNYEMFHDEAKNFDARVAQLTEQRGFLASEKDSSERTRLRTELAAQQQSCRELAADYNANSLKLNRRLFKDNNLPIVLNPRFCETPD
jgi:hypothetical protein